MKKVLLAGACAIAVSAMAMSPSFAGEHKMKNSEMKNNERHQTTGSSMSRQPSSTTAKPGAMGNDATNSSGSMSNPRPGASGAAKGGGG